MGHQLLRIACWILVATLPAASSNAQQVINILEMVRTRGTVKSVSPGLIVVTDAQGRDIEVKIQSKDEPGVSLGAGSGPIMRSR